MMNKRIKEIIAEAINNNLADIQNKDFTRLYRDLHYYKPQLTETFVCAGIHPWDYFRELPVGLARRVNIPNLEIKLNVESIRTCAFFDCSIKTLLFSGKSLKNIQEAAFKSNLMTEVELPESLTFLGQEVFADCKLLRKINIPKDCVVSKDLFAGCLNLKKVYYNGTTQDYESRFYRNFYIDWSAGSGIEEIFCTDGIINVVKSSINYNEDISDK